MLLSFLKKYKLYIIIIFSLLLLLTIFLIMSTGGPQEGPCIYQIF